MNKLFFITAAAFALSIPHTPLFASEEVKVVETSCDDLYEEAEEAMEEIRTILQSLIQELNAKYKTEITLQEACQIVRNNVDKIGIEPEDREIFLLGLEIIETGDYSKLAQLDQLLDDFE